MPKITLNTDLIPIDRLPELSDIAYTDYQLVQKGGSTYKIKSKNGGNKTTSQLSVLDLTDISDGTFFYDTTVDANVVVSGSKLKYIDLKFTSISDLKAFSIVPTQLLDSTVSAILLDGTGRSGTFELRSGAPSEAAGNYQGIELTYGGSASYHWHRIYDGYINATWFGVSNSGIDMTAPLISTLSYGETTGETIFFPDGNYYLSSELSYQTSGNLHIKGSSGATFTVASGEQFLEINGAGETGSSYNLTSDATVGDTDIVVSSSDAANFSEGDWILIKSEAVLGGPAGDVSGIKRGEFVKIKSVSSGIITLVKNLYDSYATSDTANITKILLASDVSVRGIRLNGAWKGIQFNYCENFIAEDIHVSNASKTTIATCISVGNSVNGVLKDLYLNPDNPEWAYGITIDYIIQNMKIENITGYRCRHTFTTNWNATYGQIRDVIVQNGVTYGQSSVSNLGLSGWDTHTTGENILFKNLTTYGGRDHGVQIRSWKTKVENCKAFNTFFDGFSVVYDSCSEVEFINCEADSTGRVGFAQDAQGCSPKYINCRATNNATDGFSLYDGTISGGYCSGNTDCAVRYKGTIALIIDGLEAPQDSAQNEFIIGGTGGSAYAVDLSPITVKNCIVIGYSATNIFNSNTGNAPLHYNNQFMSAETSWGYSSLVSGEKEITPSDWLYADNGSYNRKLRPSMIEVICDDTYTPTFIFDADSDPTVIDTSNNWFEVRRDLTGIVSIEDAFVYTEGTNPITGLTDGNTYYVATNSYPSDGNLRLSATTPSGSTISLGGTPAGTYLLTPTNQPVSIGVRGIGQSGFIVRDDGSSSSTSFKWKVNY